MTKIQNQNYADKQQKPTLGRHILAVGAGVATGRTIQEVLPYLSKSYLKKFNEKTNYTEFEQEIFIKEADRMVRESGIIKKGFKGIKIIDTSKDLFYLLTLQNNTPKQLEKIPKLSSVDDNKIPINKAYGIRISDIKNLIENGTLKQKLFILAAQIAAPFIKTSNFLIGQRLNNRDLYEGMLNGGMFDPLTNQVQVGKLSTALHEVGHAINTNKNFLTRIPLMLNTSIKLILMPAVILNGMFTRKPKASNSEENKRSKIKKMFDFTHKHIGLTVAGLMLPLLAEEAIASHRAIKFAKTSKLMSEGMKKQHIKALKLAYGTYLLGTVIVATTVKLVVSVKDKILEYKSKKQRAKDNVL